MIDILFRSCCSTCPNIDVNYEQTRGFGEVVTVIGCSHACVCGAYKAEEQMKPPAEDIVVKGFHNADR